MDQTREQVRRPGPGRRRVVLAVAATAVAALVVALVVVLVTHKARPAPAVMAVELDGDQLSMTSPLGRSAIRLEATLRNSATNGAFNLVRTLLDGVVVHRTSDDVAPIRTSLGTVGGNHGYARVAAFPNPDGKTTADLGSVWTDGARQYVLLAIDSTGKLVMGGDFTAAGGIVSSRPVTPRGDLTAVSGAVHRGRVPRTGTATQLHPSTAGVRVGASCDGAAISSTEQQCRQVTVRESYEVLDYGDLYDQARAHVGTSYTALAVRGAVQVENDYTFLAGGEMRLQSALVALRPTLLAETGLLQSAPLTGGKGRTVIRQVPGVEPIDGVDFRRGVDLGAYASNLHVTSGDLVRRQQPPSFSLDRIIENGRTTVGFSLGYVPTGQHAGSQSARSGAAAGDLWDLRGTGKSYPVMLTSRRLDTGDRLVVRGFRTYLAPAQADEVAAEVAEGETPACPTSDVC